MNCFQHIPGSCGALHSPCGGAPQQRGPLTPQIQTRPHRLHTHTHPPKRLAHPRSPIPPLSTLTSRATHAHPTSPRGTGFCVIWDCTTSSSSSTPANKRAKDLHVTLSHSSVGAGGFPNSQKLPVSFFKIYDTKLHSTPSIKLSPWVIPALISASPSHHSRSSSDLAELLSLTPSSRRSSSYLISSLLLRDDSSSRGIISR